jgi:hypothetical protein
MMTLQQAVQVLRTDLAGWRAHHPDASPHEVCAALDYRLQTLRQQLVRELAPAIAGDEHGAADGPRLPVSSFTPIGGRTLRLRRNAGGGVWEVGRRG